VPCPSGVYIQWYTMPKITIEKKPSYGTSLETTSHNKEGNDQKPGQKRRTITRISPRDMTHWMELLQYIMSKMFFMSASVHCVRWRSTAAH